MRELPKKMGVLDRTLSAVVATHPDADHVGGLSDVFERYRVSYYLEPGIVHDTDVTERLAAAIEQEAGLSIVTARAGQRLHLGGGAYADILYPDRDVSRLEPNSGSVAMRIVYGDTSFLLTGDAPSSVEGMLISRSSIKSDVLKAGHHGSRTSTSAAFLAAVSPSVVVVSAGKDNTYGHPHQDVLDRITSSGAEILSTAEDGTIEFVSDGEEIRQK